MDDQTLEDELLSLHSQWEYHLLSAKELLAESGSYVEIQNVLFNQALRSFWLLLIALGFVLMLKSLWMLIPLAIFTGLFAVRVKRALKAARRFNQIPVELNEHGEGAAQCVSEIARVRGEIRKRDGR